MEYSTGRKMRTVIHLQLKENGKHYYYGSVASIYECFTKEDIGITYGSLRNYALSENKPYENAKCIIRKGVLLTKEKRAK